MRSWVEKYVGLPFEANGRGPYSFDCWGLVRYVLANEFNKYLPSLLDDATAFEAKMPTVEAEPFLFACEGVVVVMNTCGRPTHVGICVDDQYVLHIEKGKGSVVERLDSRRISYRIKGFYDV